MAAPGFLKKPRRGEERNDLGGVPPPRRGPPPGAPSGVGAPDTRGAAPGIILKLLRLFVGVSSCNSRTCAVPRNCRRDVLIQPLPTGACAWVRLLPDTGVSARVFRCLRGVLG